MSEKTVEEIAIYNALLSLYCWVPTFKEPRLLRGADLEIVENAQKTIDHCFRAAVQAETERAAKVFPESVTCPACYVGPKEACRSIGKRENGGQVHPHSSRHAAAIRAEPDEKEANPIWGATTRRVESEREGGDG